MKTGLSYVLVSILILAGATGCDDDDSTVHILTIASETPMYDGDFTHSPHWAKIDNYDDWKAIGVWNFVYEEGYEYKVRVVYEKWQDGEIMDAGTHRYRLLEVLSKEKKESENIPVQRLIIYIASKGTGIPETPYYAYLPWYTSAGN